MAIVNQIFNGMKGKRDAPTVMNIPECGFNNNGFGDPTLRLNYYTVKSRPTCLNQSVLLTNMGGARGVMPCKGVDTAVRVLRRPAIPYQGGIYPHTGFARHQKIGLAYNPQKPINLPIMPLANSFNAGLPNYIPQPA